MKKPNAKHNGFKSKKMFTYTTLLLVTVTLVFIWSTFLFLRDAERDAKYLELTGDLRVFTHQISTSARESSSGGASAFAVLKKAGASFERSYGALHDGNGSLPGIGDLLESELQILNSLWGDVKTNTDTIVNTRERILYLNDKAKNLNAAIPELQREYQNVVDVLVRDDTNTKLVVKAQKQALLAERIVRHIDTMLEGGDEAKQAASQFVQDAKRFDKVLKGMLSGDRSQQITRVRNAKARASLEKIQRLFSVVSSSIDDIADAAPSVSSAQQAAEVIFADTPKLLNQVNFVSEGVRTLNSKRKIGGDLAIYSGIFILAILSFIGIQLYRNTESNFTVQKEANERNQQAIQRLLSEIATLADGDLSTQATVSEDFTGAIADSINFTIEQLREIVSSINDTTVKVKSAAENTQEKAMSLAGASTQQANKISNASSSIKDMANTIDKMSNEAAESAKVAHNSVEIAKSGTRVVQNTINGMDTIREQIQDTSKRIKRLGESSQEIGDIISLINDIADQTNILALNASIQASMAGEAGRGFAVVADEVQRLAERSSSATKQIEALVRTIQSDTNEAVISMEQTTSEVVTGAGLAHDAGGALEEIEQVSQNLSSLIEGISSAAKQQADTAGRISLTMNDVKNITFQTAEGTTDAASQMGALSDMTIELRDSVAGFKLPGDTPIDENKAAS
jgi:twitching motility protein PilJ